MAHTSVYLALTQSRLWGEKGRGGKGRGGKGVGKRRRRKGWNRCLKMEREEWKENMKDNKRVKGDAEGNGGKNELREKEKKREM